MTAKEKELKREIWKPVINYEEYEISNFGRVKRLEYDKLVCGGGLQHVDEHILKNQERKGRYMSVVLSKNGKGKSMLIHRLVAIAFIPNPDNLPHINHKDENPSNNHVDNLEWCDQKYNSNYGTSKYRIAEKLINGPLSKPVEQYSKTGEFINDFPSAIEASRTLGLNVSGIISCCNEYPKYKCSGGFQWKYKDSSKIILNIVTVRIVQYDKNNVKINDYDTLTIASKETGISRSSISNCLSGLSKSAGGFIWKKETI